MRRLSTLETGESGVIAKNSAPYPLKSRLLSMGFVRGNSIEVVTSSMLGETVMVRLNHAQNFSLRNEEAAYILLTADQYA